jgi:hypothetical protein
MTGKRNWRAPSACGLGEKFHSSLTVDPTCTNLGVLKPPSLLD